MDAWIIAMWTACIAGMMLLPLACEGLFWCFCWCFCKADAILQERHWRNRITAEDIERLREMLDKAA